MREHMEWIRFLADTAGLCWNHLNPLLLCRQVNEVRHAPIFVRSLDVASLIAPAVGDCGDK